PSTRNARRPVVCRVRLQPPRLERIAFAGAEPWMERHQVRVEQQSREATVGSRAATADIPWAPLVSQIDHVTVKPELVPGSSDRCSSNERTSRKLEGNEAAMQIPARLEWIATDLLLQPSSNTRFNLIAHVAEYRLLLRIVANRCGRIFKRPVNPLQHTGEDWTLLFGVVADSDEDVERLPNELTHRFRSVCGDVDAALLHGS